MNFKIYVIGKITSKSHKAAIAEYEKRLSRYCKIKLFQEKDLASITKKLSDKTYVVLMNEGGKSLSSEALSEKINTLGVTGHPDISIIYSEASIPCDEHLSLSNLELSTGLFSTVIFEQIYRAYRILNNEPYHK